MEKIVNLSKKPNTVNSLQLDLIELGLQKGDIVLVHSSLSKIGWVNGGAVALINALIEVLTEAGTLVMPTQSSDWSDPSGWQYPPVPKEWWEEIRATMPPYNKEHTPTSGMGIVPETFRKYSGVLRSAHPAVSFAAYGKHKETIINDHRLNFGFGEHSPLAHLYHLNAKVLFIGTTYETNTSFHLGEIRADTGKIIIEGASIIEENKIVWKEYEMIDFADENFQQMGIAFEKKYSIINGQVGQAKSKLFSLRDSVDFSEAYYKNFHNSTQSTRRKK